MSALSQAIAVSFPAIVADARKPNNQWAESAFLTALERKGFVEKQSGDTVEAPIDYRKNPGTDVLATESTALSTTVTDVLAAASYDWANVVVPITYTLAQEAKNQGEAKKIAFIKSIVTNAINSHDDEIEADLFSTSTDGLLGLQNLVPASGQPNVGGIDGATAAYWRNATDTFDANGADLVAAMTSVFNSAAKGSGSASMPTLIVSGSASQALYEAQLQQNARYMRMGKGDAGFDTLAFKTADYIFSQHGGDNIYFLNPKAFKLVTSRNFFRRLREGTPYTNMAGTQQLVYSQCQAIVTNPSRLAVLAPSGS